jgi:hypothetical protein
MLAWAERHLEGLEAAIRAYTKKNPTVVVTQYDSETGEMVASLRVRNLPETADWTFRIGDAVHALRVSLDYLAFGIVTSRPHTLKIEKVAFPICNDPSKYPGLEGRRIGKELPAEIRAVIESFQPYNRQHSPEPEPLLSLDTLENIHKHRRLLIAEFLATDLSQIGHSDKIQITSISLPAGILKDGTELYRYKVTDSLHAEDDVKFQFRSYVSFNEPGPMERLIVVREIKRIRDHIRDDIFPALEPFL